MAAPFPHLHSEPNLRQPFHFLVLKGTDNVCGAHSGECEGCWQDLLKANGLGLPPSIPGPLQN